MQFVSNVTIIYLHYGNDYSGIRDIMTYNHGHNILEFTMF